MGLAQAVEPRVVQTENVRATLAAVDSGDADAAIVYVTDARVAKSAQVAFEIPRRRAAAHRLRGARSRATREQPERATRFLDFLAGAEASGILRAGGLRATRSAARAVSDGRAGSRMLALTLRVAGVATLLALPPAVALGYLLARQRFRGRALVQALVALPMVLPPVAVGLGLLWLLGRRGPLGALWQALGIEIVFSWWAAVLAAALVGFPLLHARLRAGLRRGRSALRARRALARRDAAARLRAA